MRTKKHQFQNPGVVEHYEKFHSLCGNEKTVAKQIIDNLTWTTEEFCILDAGSGDGSRFLIPLIREFLTSSNACTSLRIVCLDNSKPMREKLIKNLSQLNAEQQPQTSQFKVTQNGRLVTIEVLDVDVEARAGSFQMHPFGKTKFDVLFCNFLLHHLVNWRLALSRLIRLLKPEGIIVLAERTSDLLYMDGNFSTYNPETITPLQLGLMNFMEARNREWVHHPEVSGTNCEQVVFALTASGAKIIVEVGPLEWQAKNDIYSRIIDGSLTAFWLGLPKTQVSKILTEAKFPQGEQVYTDGIKLHFIGVSNPKLTGERILFQFPRSITSKLHHPIVHQTFADVKGIISKQISRTLSLLATHDAFTIMTKFAIGVYWSPVTRSWNPELQTMVFDNEPIMNEHLGKRMSRLLRYFSATQEVASRYEGKENVQVTDLLFRDFKQKPIVVFRNQTSKNPSTDEVKIEYRWSTSLDPRGMPSCSHIFVDLPTPADEAQYPKNVSTYDWLKHEKRLLRSNWRLIHFNEVRSDEEIRSDNQFKFGEGLKSYRNEIQLPAGLIAGNQNQRDETNKIFNELLPLVKVLMTGYLTHLIFAPTQYYSENDSEPSRGYGGIIFGENIEGLSGHINEKLIEGNLLLRAELCSLVTTRTLAQTGIIEYRNHSLEQATRSAVSAIMGRVNAHDFGHVLTNAKLPLEKDVDELTANKNYFKHLTRFARELMVFASEASINDPSWTMSLPLMSQIIHPFSKYFTEHDKDEQSPVCQHIAASEGVKRVDIKTVVDNNLLTYEYSQEERGWSSRLGVNKEPSDFYVSVPTGLVGAHAFYCILENIIRNGAKYGSSEVEDGTLELNINISTSSQNNYYRVRVWDNYSKFTREKLRNICKFFSPELSLCHSIADENEELYRITDDEGLLVSGGWGIKEMRIAAAWLRKMPVAQAITGTEPDPPLLKPIVIKLDGTVVELSNKDSVDSFIGYEFYLLKPKEMLVVDPVVSQGIAGDARLKTQLEMRGIDALEKLDTETQGAVRHSMFIVNNSDSVDFLRKNHNALPCVALLGPKIDRSPELPNFSHLEGHEYAALIKDLTDNPGNSSQLLKVRLRWAREILGTPRKPTLVLQLAPNKNQPVASGLKDYWKNAADELNKSADNIEIVIEEAWRHVIKADAPTAIYDYHSVWNSDKASNKSCKYGEPAFYESYSKTNPTHVALFNPPSDVWMGARILCGLIESAFAKVTVVDERIWQKRSKDHEQIVKSNLLLPPVRAGFYKNPVEEDGKTLLKILAENETKILLIHQGMLDKMFDTKQKSDGWIDSVKRVVPVIVVQSDRGESLLPRLPSNVRFAPYSATERWIANKEDASKYFLVQTLLSAIKGIKTR